MSGLFSLLSYWCNKVEIGDYSSGLLESILLPNSKKEFIAKSKEAIFYKSSGKIKLIGDVEVVTSDSNIIRAGEIIYYLKENNFKAVSNLNQRVNTKFIFNKNKDTSSN